MAAPDSIFEILIRYGLDAGKAKEATAELKKLEEQTKATGKEGVRQEEAVTEATKKTTSAKRQLKAAVKGLAFEFPILGKVAALAMNPISLSVAGLVVAYKTAQDGMAKIKESFGGFELPATTETKIEQVEKLAAAYGRLNENVGKLGTTISGAKTELADIQEAIATNDKFLRGLWIDTGTEGAEAQQNAASGVAATLRASGRAKVASGTSLFEDELGKLKMQATAAEAALEAQKERRALLNKFLPGGKNNAVDAFAFGRQYGLDTTAQDALAAEDLTTAQAQAAIGRYETARKRRDLRRQGLAEIAAADEITRSNVSARRGTFADSGGAIGQAVKAAEAAGTDFRALATAIGSLAVAVSESRRLAEQANREARSIQNIQSQRQ